MTGRDKRTSSNRVEITSHFRRPVRIGTRHGRTSSGSNGPGSITLSSNTVAPSMKTARGGQQKSSSPTPKAETENAAASIEEKRSHQGHGDGSLQSQSWETMPQDNEEAKKGMDDGGMKEQLAELERALETTRGEQQRMVQELQKLRLEREKHQQGTRELQEKMAKLRLDHEQDLHTLQAKLNEESKSSEYWSKKHQTALADFYGLKERWLERDELWKHEWERKAAEVLEERDQLREKLHTTQKVAQVQSEENEEARRQLLDLKQNISTSTRIESQVTDHEFADMMSGLNHEIQNWIVQYFRKSKNDFSNLTTSLRNKLRQAVPLYEHIISSSRLVLYQAFVMDHLMEIFEAPLFFGLPEEGPLSHIKALTNYLQPLSSDFGQWRSLTFGIIDQDDHGDVTEHTRKTLDSMQAVIEEALSQLTATEPSTSQRTSLRTILENSARIARLVRRQRAHFVFELPKVSAERKAVFDGKVMEDVNGEDEEELKGTKVQCATFPAVYKLGDERGENMHLRNVIFKARVLCT